MLHRPRDPQARVPPTRKQVPPGRKQVPPGLLNVPYSTFAGADPQTGALVRLVRPVLSPLRDDLVREKRTKLSCDPTRLIHPGGNYTTGLQEDELSLR